MNTVNAIETSTFSFSIMGILNVTPDSFYDGGKYYSIDDSVAYACKMAADGADIIDIGGASSRPGAQVIEIKEEIKRIIPVIKGIRRKSSIPISVDTTWSEVAVAALDEGANWINDISAGRFDSKIATVVARKNASVVLMHSRGTPQTMQENPLYNNVVEDVKHELTEAAMKFLDAGVHKESIIIDPGIGFCKTFEHNCTLLKELSVLCQLGYPVLVGTSRKSFIGSITGRVVADRLAGSLGSVASAFLQGARIFRVHDVAPTLDLLKVLSAIKNR